MQEYVSVIHPLAFSHTHGAALQRNRSMHCCPVPQQAMRLVQGTGNVGSLFVEAMTKEATSEKDTQVWQSILRNLFSTLKEMSFTEPITALESKLFALDVFLRSPMLQRLLVSRDFVPH